MLGVVRLDAKMQIQICSKGKRASLIAVIKVLLGICGTPFSYVFSFLANNPASGLISLLIVPITIIANTLKFSFPLITNANNITTTTTITIIIILQIKGLRS